MDLSKIEALILQIIVDLGDNAYGYKIVQERPDKLGLRWIYIQLKGLRKRRFVERHKAPSTAGEYRMVYRLTELGQDALDRWALLEKYLASHTQDQQGNASAGRVGD